MKKLLCFLLVLCMLPVPAVWAQESYSAASFVTEEQPSGTNVQVTYSVEDGFYKKAGSTPWSFEHATVEKDNYEPLEFIDSGWYYESYQNWAQGAVQHYLSMHAGMAADPVVAFTAPIDGTIMIHASKADKTSSMLGDGVQLKILRNSEQVYPAEDWVVVEPGATVELPNLVFDVKKGDVIRFRVNCIGNQTADGIRWEKKISYLGKEAMAQPVEDVTFEQPEDMTIATTYTVADGFAKNPGETPWGFEHAVVNTDNYEPLEFIQNGWYSGEYQNWAQGTVQHPLSMHAGMIADPVVSFTAPIDGTVLIHATKADKTSSTLGDGVQLKILKNNQQVYPSLGWAQVLPGQVVELPDIVFKVKKGDVIRFRVNCIENQSADGIHWEKTISYLMDASNVVPASGVSTTIPEGAILSEGTTPVSAFEGTEGTDWKFQVTPIGLNDYTDMEYIQSGWYVDTYMNWRSGAAPYRRALSAGEANDACYTYTCPKDGTIVLLENVAETRANSRDGNKFCILKNDQNIYPDMAMVEIKPGKQVKIPNLVFPVKKGDKIYFRANCNASQTADMLVWEPTVCYIDGMGEVVEKALFTDLTDHWAREAVENLFHKGIVVGKSEGIFDPEARVTRAEFLTMVQKAAKIQNVPHKDYFPDVPLGSWFTNTINAAFAFDLIADELVVDGNFLPDQPLLREEATGIMVDTMQNKKFRALGEGDLSKFTDAAQCAEWVRPSIAQAVSLGLILGNPDGTFAPKNTISRAEAAVILNRFLTATETKDAEGTYSKTYDAPFYTEVDIDKMINDAYASGAKEVLLPAGAYLVPFKGGKHIKMTGMKDFTVKGQNTTLIFENPTGVGIDISNCENVSFVGLNTDFEECGFYQGKVIALADDNRYADIELDPAYPHHFLDTANFYTDTINARFFDDQAIPVKNLNDRGHIASYEKIGQYKYRMYFSRSDVAPKLKPGYLVGERAKSGTNFNITASYGIKLNDCNIYTGLLGINEGDSEGGTILDNVHFIPGPTPDGAQHSRLFSITGTGIFIRNVRQGMQMNNISVVRNNDDGINIHSVYGRVAEQVDDTTVIIGMRYNYDIFKAGDEVRFATETDENTKTGYLDKGSAKIVSFEKLSGYTSPVDLSFRSVTGTTVNHNHYYKMKLDKKVSVSARDLFEDATMAADGLVIKNSKFEYNMPRSIMLHANNALIENCTFTGSMRYAILMDPEVDWGESGYVHNTTIKGCTFNGCAYSMKDGAALALMGYEGQNHKNIVFEGNTFNNTYYNDVIINCATNMTLKNNIFNAHNPENPVAYPAVDIDKSDKVKLEGNTFNSAANGVKVGEKATNVTGI
ncbi:MAG: S-layer homology domain-containing protein [Clostridia bacterium]|nr:S-layer homology domain-containing protein [Clostridia bacterium]